MQLKHKLPLILFVAYTLLVGSLVFYALYSSSKTRRVSQFEAAKAQAHNYSHIITSFMAERVAELESLEKGMALGGKPEILLKKFAQQSFVSDVYVKFGSDAPHVSKPYLTNPYYSGTKTIITLNYPIFINKKFTGMAGMDFELSKLKSELLDAMQDKAKEAYVIFIPQSELPADLKTDIAKGIDGIIVQKSDVTHHESVMAYVPFFLKGVDAPWAVGYVISDEILRSEELGVRYRTAAGLVLIDVLWGVFLLLLMSRVFGHLHDMVGTLRKMTDGDGDLTIRLAVNSKDEIGEMSKGLNRLIEKLHSTIKTTQRETKNLLETSSVLAKLSHNLSTSSKSSLEQSGTASKSTEDASEHARAIAGEATKTSSHTNDLSNTAGQMSDNMNSVASAVEELSASFKEITNNTDESRKIATDATKKSDEATDVMNKLGLAAREIGQVTEVIKRIAEKTNLLALNATIEAAAAGNAGKGFAVVANEIKELATQSAKSADDIAHRIEGIQSGTSNAVDVIHKVSEIITKINSSIDGIANSVSQQTIASSEISNNAGQANVGSRQLVRSISEIAHSASASVQNAENVAKGTRSVSEGVSVMFESSKKSSSNSSELDKTATELKSLAEHLESLVGKFKT